MQPVMSGGCRPDAAGALREWMAARRLDVEAMASDATWRLPGHDPDLISGAVERVRYRARAMRLLREILAGAPVTGDHAEVLGPELAGMLGPARP